VQQLLLLTEPIEVHLAETIAVETIAVEETEEAVAVETMVRHVVKAAEAEVKPIVVREIRIRRSNQTFSGLGRVK
jgi:hypothetical protein